MRKTSHDMASSRRSLGIVWETEETGHRTQLGRFQNIVQPAIKLIKKRDETNTYLTHVCRHHSSGNNPDKRFNMEVSAQTVVYISCRLRPIKLISLHEGYILEPRPVY